MVVRNKEVHQNTATPMRQGKYACSIEVNPFKGFVQYGVGDVLYLNVAMISLQ